MSNAKKGQKPRKVPLRRCLGCGESFPKKDLMRVVRSPEGEVALDFTGKMSDRGAYVCKRSACFQKARKAKRFQNNLEISISEEVLDALAQEIRLFEKENADG